MAQFGGVDSGLLVGKYLNKVRVYVESSEDRDVLEKWFQDDLGKITFLSADHGNAGGGGCQAVCEEVSSSAQAGIKAVGVVDRDKLFTDKNWSLLWEVDDQVFRAAQPYGTTIHVLLRWELENYILEPKAVHRVLIDAKHGQQSPTHEQVEQELIDHCGALVPIGAALVLLHEQGCSAFGIGYGSSMTRVEIEQDLLSKCLPRRLVNMVRWEEKFHNNQMLVESFDKPAYRSSDRLAACLRIVDGKRLLERVKKKHGIQAELRGFLSRAIKELGLVPSELSTLIAAL